MNAASSEDRKIFFIADIGTTTVKASLCVVPVDDMDAAITVPAVLSEKNAQSVFGLDVISRVLYAHHNGVEKLQQKILDQLMSMLDSLCKTADVIPETVSEAVITGNTVMTHLVRGLSVQGFEIAPFTPVTTEEAYSTFGSLSGRQVCLPDMPVYFPPCIDAFLGADAVCAALFAVKALEKAVSEMRYPLLVVDVGTNTEIMLLKADALTCCSTAAGPAFEGGVCGGRFTGSELVHQLAELLKSGAMDETGFLDDASVLPAEKGGALSQDDIRQLQLAKGAVCAAIETVLNEEGITAGDVGTLVLCGNFGSALQADEAAQIGLFPTELTAVTVYAGNASEKGARLLVAPEMRGLAKKIAASGKLIQLADSRFFARRYIERMNFSL